MGADTNEAERNSMFTGRCNLTADLVVCHEMAGCGFAGVAKGWAAFRSVS